MEKIRPNEFRKSVLKSLSKKIISKVEAKDRLKFMTDLLPYLMPKLQSTTYSQKIDLDGMTEDELDILIQRIVND